MAMSTTASRSLNATLPNRSDGMVTVMMRQRLNLGQVQSNPGASLLGFNCGKRITSHFGFASGGAEQDAGRQDDATPDPTHAAADFGADARHVRHPADLPALGGRASHPGQRVDYSPPLLRRADHHSGGIRA